MKLFKDRQAAGKLLAQHLTKYKHQRNTIVLGIPRGGVVVASEVAKRLKLPLDVVVTRKIGAPSQPELALGAVNADGEVIWDNQLLSQLEFKISNLKFKIEDEKKEIHRREEIYRQDREPLDVRRKTIILMDDGIATGATVLSAIFYLKKHKAKRIILAVPIASKESADKLSQEVNEMVVLEIPGNFQAVGQFYYKFEQVEDEEVIQLLKWKRSF